MTTVAATPMPDAPEGTMRARPTSKGRHQNDASRHKLHEVADKNMPASKGGATPVKSNAFDANASNDAELGDEATSTIDGPSFVDTIGLLEGAPFQLAPGQATPSDWAKIGKGFAPGFAPVVAVETAKSEVPSQALQNNIPQLTQTTDLAETASLSLIPSDTNDAEPSKVVMPVLVEADTSVTQAPVGRVPDSQHLETMPNVRVAVIAQESHWAIGASSQRLSARTSEVLAFSGLDARPTRAEQSSDTLPRTGKASAVFSELPAIAPSSGARSTGAHSDGSDASRSGSGQSGFSNNAGDSQLQSLSSDGARPKVEANRPVKFGDVLAGDVKSPAMQIVDHVTNSAAEVTSEYSRPETVQAPNRGVLRHLEIKLDPANLGEVQLTMSMRDNQLGVQIVASNGVSARLISDDRQQIDSALKKAGYELVDFKVDAVNTKHSADAIAAPMPAGSSGMSNNTTSNGSQSAAQAMLFQSSNGGSSDNRGGRDRHAAERGVANSDQSKSADGTQRPKTASAMYI